MVLVYQEPPRIDEADYQVPQYVLADVFDGRPLKPHELIEHVDLPAIAQAHNATVVESLDALKRLREARPDLQSSHVSGQMRDLVHEVLSLGHLVTVFGRHIGERARLAAGEVLGGYAGEGKGAGIRHVSGTPNGLRALLAPGFTAFNDHMRDSLRGLPIPLDVHKTYDYMMPNRDVAETAADFAEAISSDGIPTVLHAHSQGGQVALLAAHLLEQSGHGGLVAGLILVSPASSGPAPWVQQLIESAGKHLFPHLRDMLTDSEPIRAWQDGLSPTMRQRTVVIQSAHVGGDGVTTPENSFVPGSKMLAMHDTFPHESAGRDPRNPAAQLARAVIGAMNDAYQRYSLSDTLH